MARTLLVLGGLLVVGAAVGAALLSMDAGSFTPRTRQDVADPWSSHEVVARDASAGDRPCGPPDPQEDEPEDATSGYAGTAAARRTAGGGRVRRRARPAAAATQAVGPDDVAPERLAARLAVQTGYPRFLEAMHRLSGPALPVPRARRADGQDDARETLFLRHPERMAPHLDAALAAATRGVVRQAIIFHMAIALPPELARPRLRELQASRDPDDSEDALCALAFTGDEAALVEFEFLSFTPTACAGEIAIRRVEQADRIFREGRRDILRSYRSIEALDGAPYFWLHGEWMEGAGLPFPWASATPRPASHVERALTAWLRRYPGHAGTDDMCYRLAQSCIAEGRDVEALRWASRGTTEPDGDMLRACASTMVSLVELAPPGSAVTLAVIDPDAPQRNRDLLLYLRLRRLTQDLGWKAGLGEMAALAAAEPDLLLSRGWRERWSAPVSGALDSGLSPLPPDDPLRRTERRPDLPEPNLRYAFSRLRIWPADTTSDRVDLDLRRLRRQFRAWETLAELEARRAFAEWDDALDLLYKQGAVHYHEPDVLYPVYAGHWQHRSGTPSARWLAGRFAIHDPKASWVAGALQWNLAIARFEEVLQCDPGHALADDALYSIALAHVKAADDNAVRQLGVEARDAHLQDAVRVFEELQVRQRGSPLAKSAEAAARYWRVTRSDLF